MSYVPTSKPSQKTDMLTEEMLKFKKAATTSPKVGALQQHSIADIYEKPQRPQWEIVEKLYRKETKLLDRNLEKLHDFLKPQAKSIYYDRKVEYINMVHEKQKHDAAKLNSVVRKVNKQDGIVNDEYQNTQRELVEIMTKYDIKHPLRGLGFENTPAYKQQFKDKILGVLGGTNAYLGYKKDQRGTMDTTYFDEKYLKEEQDKFNRDRVEMTYRLYGKDGLQKHEQEKLKEWKVIRPSSNLKMVRTKKRVKKSRKNKETKQWETYSSDKEGENDSCYSTKFVQDYEDNEEGDDILKFNFGYQIKPLCKEIFGKNAAKASQKRHTAKTFEQNQEKIRLMIEKTSPGRGKFGVASLKHPQSIGGRNLSLNDTFQSSNNQKMNMLKNIQNSSSRAHTRNQSFMQGSNVSMPSSTIDMSFLPASKAVAPVASNKPNMRNAIVMPHLANRLTHQDPTSFNRHGSIPYHTIQQLDNSSERSNDEHSHINGAYETVSVGSSYRMPNNTGITGHIRTNTDLMAAAYQTAGSAFAQHASQQNHVGHGFSGHLRPRIDEQNQTMIVLPSATGRQVGDRATHRVGFPGKNMNSSPTGGMSFMGANSMTSTHQKSNASNRMRVPMDALSQYSTTIKGDLRKRGSPFRYRSKDGNSALKAQENRRALGEGRANKIFSGATPTLKDSDIKELIQKYPVGDDHVRGDEDQDGPHGDKGSEKSIKNKQSFNEHSTDPTYIAINSPTTDKAERKQLMHKAIGNLTRNIDKMEAQSKAYYKEMITKMVVQNLRDAELQKLAEAFKEIDYADAEQLQNLFEYRSKDQVEKIRGQVDVAKEYHEGKLDPQKMATKRDRKKR